MTPMKKHCLSKSLKINQSFKAVEALLVTLERNGKVDLMYQELGHLHTRAGDVGDRVFLSQGFR